MSPDYSKLEFIKAARRICKKVNNIAGLFLLWMHDVLWFNFVRKFWKYWNRVIPKWMFYVYYKIIGLVKNVFVDTKDFIWDVIFRVKDFAMGVSGGFWFLMKKGYRMSSVVLGKIMFWRKKKVMVEGKGEKEKKAEGDEGKEKED